MLNRLYDNWVYGGFLMGLALLFALPLLQSGLSWAGALTLGSLSAYAIHQYEEHDADRFRLFVNAQIAKGRAGLSRADVFFINVVVVWGLIILSLWLTERRGQEWASLPALLMVVNALAHVSQAMIMRKANPGVWTALALFLPLGCYILWQVWPQVQPATLAICLVIILALHAGIALRARRATT